VGTRRFREDLQRERGLSPADANKLLQGFEPNEALTPFLQSRGEELAVGIERAAAFLQTGARSAEGLSRLYTSGGGARIPGLSKALSDRLKLPVEMANPIKRLQVGDGVFDGMNVDEIAPLLMLPVGLALRTAA
jgi:type IV pilus assembly protein PilM